MNDATYAANDGNVSGPIRKGVVLAGGGASRLFPLTVAVNKHLLPVYDKPMVYYPLSTLMLAGIRDVLVVSAPEHLSAFERLLGDGSQLGMRISYGAQRQPLGVADGLRVAETFLAGEGCALALGDNLFWGNYLGALSAALVEPSGATIFAHSVEDASRYGVVELDANGRPTGIEEKPVHPRSRLAVPGLYVLDGASVAIAHAVSESARGELEIADVLRQYLRGGSLRVVPLDGEVFWVDMGTLEGLLAASEFVAAIQTRQGLLVGCVEEVALHMGWRTQAEVRAALEDWPASPYRTHVEALLQHDE
jgi:glucose-1-phosphate thymidylyltransferase